MQSLLPASMPDWTRMHAPHRSGSHHQSCATGLGGKAKPRPMSQIIEIDGWRLTTTLPSGLVQARQQLVTGVLCAAEGHSVAPMRRSRRAVTYNCRVTALTDTPPVFVKVIAPPRGIDRLKRMLRGSDAAQVAGITSQIINAGFNAPPVWIWGNHSSTGRELVVTPRARGYGPLRALSMLAGAPQAKWRLLKALGEEIARFHRAGFIHGDLTPFNLFISPGENPDFALLDHERTRS